jgi:copper chaperone CopZ
MEKKTFQVPNIGCDGCVNSIKNELKGVPGVQSVEGNVDSKTVTVQWTDPASWTKIVDVLKEIDYAPAEA